jgi:hypothetical protein
VGSRLRLSDQANMNDIIGAREKLDLRACRIVERMIALKPKTPKGIAAIAATLKEDLLSHHWKEQEEDRDYDVHLTTQFLDGLIEVGQLQGNADRVLTEPDPVLGLVANLCVAWDRLRKALENTTHFEPHPLVEEAHREIDAALAALQATPPTTLAGARAAIARLVEYDEHNVPEESGKYLRTLSRSPIFAL